MEHSKWDEMKNKTDVQFVKAPCTFSDKKRNNKHKRRGNKQKFHIANVKIAPVTFANSRGKNIALFYRVGEYYRTPLYAER